MDSDKSAELVINTDEKIRSFTLEEFADYYQDHKDEFMKSSTYSLNKHYYITDDERNRYKIRRSKGSVYIERASETDGMNKKDLMRRLAKLEGEVETLTRKLSSSGTENVKTQIQFTKI